MRRVPRLVFSLWRCRIKLVQECCSRLTAAGGKPGLSPHAATALLVLLRRLNGSLGTRAPPPVSLTKVSRPTPGHYFL